MSNRLRLTGILTPPSDDAFRPGVGYVKFEPADEAAANWAVPGYRPAWPILGVPNAVGGALQEINGGDVYVPGDEPGDAHAGPWMRVTYELQTTAGTWHRGTYLWRAVSTGGGVIDIRTPAPEQEPPIVARPGVPAGALRTTDVGNLVPSMAEFGGALARLGNLEHAYVIEDVRADRFHVRRWSNGVLEIFGSEEGSTMPPHGWNILTWPLPATFVGPYVVQGRVTEARQGILGVAVFETAEVQAISDNRATARARHNFDAPLPYWIHYIAKGYWR